MTQATQTYKIALLGDKHSGKRSLLQHAFEASERTSDFYMPIEFVEVNGKNADGSVKAYFFDSLINTTQVPEEDSSCVDVFASEVLTNARAVLLCYSCTNEDSLDSIIMWNRLARKHINPSTHIYLVGTKFDGAATVDDDVYEHIRDSLGHIHGDYRTSAITGENVKALFARVFNGFTELPLTINTTELTLPMLRTPTKFNLSASKLNLSTSRLNLSNSKIHVSPTNKGKTSSSYGIVLTSPKGTTSLRKLPTTNDQASLTEMVAPEKDVKNQNAPHSFNITISKIFGRGAAAPTKGHDNTLDTSLGGICGHNDNRPQNNRSVPSKIFGTSQKKYAPEDDLFSSRNNSFSRTCFRENSMQPGLNYSHGMNVYRSQVQHEVRGARYTENTLDSSMGRGLMNQSSSMRHSLKSLQKSLMFAKLAPKHLEEDRTELEDETLDESAIVKGSNGKNGKKVRVVLPGAKLIDDSIVMDIKYNKEDEEQQEAANNNVEKTPKFEVSEIKEDSRYNHQDSKYVLKIWF